MCSRIAGKRCSALNGAESSAFSQVVSSVYGIFFPSSLGKKSNFCISQESPSHSTFSFSEQIRLGVFVPARLELEKISSSGAVRRSSYDALSTGSRGFDRHPASDAFRRRR